MSAVRGGSNVNAFNNNFASSGGFASSSAVIAPVTQVVASSKTTSELPQNFGGFQFVGLK